jgi:hypothetical protein
VGIEQVHRCTGEEDRTAECSVEENTLPSGHLSLCTDRHRRRELFEFWSWRKYPLKDIHWVVEHPERLNKELLE